MLEGAEATVPPPFELGLSELPPPGVCRAGVAEAQNLMVYLVLVGAVLLQV